jgi:hypothetical protein
MRTTKTRTTIAALAAAVVLSATGATGVASAAVPQTGLGEAPTTADPTTGATGVSARARAASDPGSTVPPLPGPTDGPPQAQVFNPVKMRNKQKICDGYQAIYEQAVSDAVQIDGNPDGQNQGDADAAASDQAANETRDAAKAAGCGWAA